MVRYHILLNGRIYHRKEQLQVWSYYFSSFGASDIAKYGRVVGGTDKILDRQSIVYSLPEKTFVINSSDLIVNIRRAQLFGMAKNPSTATPFR